MCPAPPIQEAILEAVKVLPQKRISERMMEQVEDSPQILKGTAKEMRLSPREQVSAKMSTRR